VRGDPSLVFGTKHVEEKYFKYNGLFDNSNTNLYINHNDNVTVAAVEQPAAVHFPGLIVRPHGLKHCSFLLSQRIHIEGNCPKTDSEFFLLCPSQFNTAANISAEPKHIKLQVQYLQTAQCKAAELIQRELDMFHKEYLHLYVVDQQTHTGNVCCDMYYQTPTVLSYLHWGTQLYCAHHNSVQG
jgi:hypothetical protein